jgi:hypothetical protein
MQTLDWAVRIRIEEDADRTHAQALLDEGNGITFHGDGSARRNPLDAPVPEIGEELATARALYALADRLMDEAYRDVENLSHPLA